MVLSGTGFEEEEVEEGSSLARVFAFGSGGGGEEASCSTGRRGSVRALPRLTFHSSSSSLTGCSVFRWASRKGRKDGGGGDDLLRTSKSQLER